MNSPASTEQTAAIAAAAEDAMSPGSKVLEEAFFAELSTIGRGNQRGLFGSPESAAPLVRQAREVARERWQEGIAAHLQKKLCALEKPHDRDDGDSGSDDSGGRVRKRRRKAGSGKGQGSVTDSRGSGGGKGRKKFSKNAEVCTSRLFPAHHFPAHKATRKVAAIPPS